MCLPGARYESGSRAGKQTREITVRNKVLLPVATALAGVNTALLLRRLRNELTETGQLSPRGVAWMYGTYAAHGALTAGTLIRRNGHLPLPGAASAVAGGMLTAAGTGLTVAGMSRFGSPRQISGTDTGELVVSGAYRVSRNPQYTGYVLALTGLALARRSTQAAMLAAGAAGIFHWWVPVEERHLENEFGPAYRDYRERVPRWLGRPAQR